MRFAFVIRLGPETEPGLGLFEGWAEDVDLSIQRRFHSAEQLLEFLGQRFDAAAGRQAGAAVGRIPLQKKAARRRRKPS